MKDLKLEPVSAEALPSLLADIKPILEAKEMDVDALDVRVSPLTWYDDYNFYILQDHEQTRHMLYKPGDAELLNWTNEVIYRVNDKAPIRLDRKNVIPYAKFFFHYVRGQLGRFIIVEKPEEVAWLDNATPEEMQKVNDRLMPVTYKGIGRDNRYLLTASVVFKNALFKTNIRVAPDGLMELTDEELLLEDLNVPIDPPPPLDF
ncbi:MAG: hypothetical protein EB059_07610 [Alphaproteobacteria bacterium]|nr:hypothetical protein [Alphaproteobacteria bacterium]